MITREGKGYIGRIEERKKKKKIIPYFNFKIN